MGAEPGLGDPLEAEVERFWARARDGARLTFLPGYLPPLAGAGPPRALLETTDVQVVPFDQVSAEHAYAEGEGDLGLEHRREVHEASFAAGSGFDPGMPVVPERLRVVLRA